MAFWEAVRLALQTIRAQKLKSAFSIIGVFIGVMFLIAVVSVVQGMNRYMTDKFAGTLLGVNTFRLRQFPDVQLGNVTDSTWRVWRRRPRVSYEDAQAVMRGVRSEEHTSELQSRRDLVCRLLLEKKNAGYLVFAAGMGGGFDLHQCLAE